MSPIVWIWEGDVMRPAHRFVDQANRDLVVGERYLMEPIDETQSARDRAYHAELRDLWSNLPETLAERFPNPTDFRRWLLCECGFCDTAKLAFASAKAAMAALPLLQAGGAMVAVNGAVVVAKTAWSQKLRGGMKKDDRLRSYKDTLDLASSIVGTTSEHAARNVRSAA